jgi:tetratricopeptide (TPR) repeat protein
MAYYFKALCLIRKREPKLAQQDLQKAVELNPRLLDARLILAQFYLRDRDQNMARKQIESALKLAPRDVRALMLQGGLKILERDIKGAEAAYKEVVELYPDNVPGHIRLGLVYNLTKREKEALKSFKTALELSPQQTDALTLMVGIYVREKKFDEAIQICEKQKQKAGENPTQMALIEYLEGNIFLAKKDMKWAQQHFETAIKTDPNILAPYEALARIYMREQKLEEAILQFEHILTKNPNYLAGYMALGTIYDKLGDKEVAETYYRKALEIKGDFAPAANNLAWNLAEKGGNLDEALSFAQIAKEKVPQSAAVMDTLGWIYYLKGSYLNAIAEFQDSLSRTPDNPVINYHMGLAYNKTNQPDKAREFLEKALQIDPDFKGAEEARSILEEIKASNASE